MHLWNTLKCLLCSSSATCYRCMKRGEVGENCQLYCASVAKRGQLTNNMSWRYLWKSSCGGGDANSWSGVARWPTSRVRWTATVRVHIRVSESQSIYGALDLSWKSRRLLWCSQKSLGPNGCTNSEGGWTTLCVRCSAVFHKLKGRRRWPWVSLQGEGGVL